MSTQHDRAMEALRGIAVYAAHERRELHRRPAAQRADTVLRNIEQHALEVLDGCQAPQPSLRRHEVAVRAAARWPVPLTKAQAAAVLLDPPDHLQRVPVVDVLSVVADLGPHGARRLLRAHHIAHHTWVGARTWTRLADTLTANTGATA